MKNVLLLCIMFLTCNILSYQTGIACQNSIPMGSYVLEMITITGNSQPMTDTSTIKRWWSTLQVDTGGSIEVRIMADKHYQSMGALIPIGQDSCYIQLFSPYGHLDLIQGTYCIENNGGQWSATLAQKNFQFKATSMNLDSLIAHFCPRPENRIWVPGPSLMEKLDSLRSIIPIQSNVEKILGITSVVHESVFYGTLETSRLMQNPWNQNIGDISAFMQSADSFMICSGFSESLIKAIQYILPNACTYLVTIGDRTIPGRSVGHAITMIIANNDTIVLDAMFNHYLCDADRKPLSLREGVYRILSHNSNVFWKKISDDTQGMFLQSSPCLNSLGAGYASTNTSLDISRINDSLFVIKGTRSFEEYLLGFETDYTSLSQNNAAASTWQPYPVYDGDTANAIILFAHIHGIWEKSGNGSCASGEELYQEILTINSLVLANETLSTTETIFPTTWVRFNPFPTSWSSYEFYSLTGTKILRPEKAGMYVAKKFNSSVQTPNVHKVLVY